MLGAGYPVSWGRAFKVGIRSLFSEKMAKAVDEAINTSKYASLYEQAGLYIAPRLGVAARPTAREEYFMTRYAQKIPFIRMSERSYVTFLNKLRTDVFNQIAEQWEGTDKTTKDYQDLAKFINHSTGRGTLGALNRISGGLNALFFSPRFVASRIEAPLDVFTKSKAARMKIARSLVSFVSTGITILSLAALAGLDVELDPRSADFGKIRIGRRRIDFWAGFVQIARFITMLILNQRKSTRTGKIIKGGRGPYSQTRLRTVWNFLRSKMSPTAGLGVDILAGETFMGERVEPTPATIKQQARQRLVPIFIQDCWEEIESENLYMLPISGPLSFFGVGVQIYKPQKPKRKKRPL